MQTFVPLLDSYIAHSLTSLASREKGRPMGSSVFIRLKNGRTVSLLENAEKAAAEQMRAKLHRWVHTGQGLHITHLSGGIEDVTPSGVEAIEIVETPPPKRTGLDIV
jgi:hypothetical protein